jgi:hypothetical protein
MRPRHLRREQKVVAVEEALDLPVKGGAREHRAAELHRRHAPARLDHAGQLRLEPSGLRGMALAEASGEGHLPDDRRRLARIVPARVDGVDVRAERREPLGRAGGERRTSGSRPRSEIRAPRDAEPAGRGSGSRTAAT